ncbi:MAG: co-chaperone GroES [Magnetococcales bacterium]|nr:co-chaperone GroES [Magnetococcales bacterium]
MDNKSGIIPVEYKCLIMQDKVEETTKGGVIIPVALVETRQHAETQAVLIAAGGNAFDKWIGICPKPGDRVLTARYAGAGVKGADGVDYRLVLDTDITGIMKGENNV